MATHGATAVIIQSNPIRPFKGSARRGETDFVEGPDFESWRESILAYCRTNNITDSADIIVLAKTNIDPNSGDAYATIFCCPAFANKNYIFTDHNEFFDTLRSRYTMTHSSPETRMASLLVDMMSLERGANERFSDFMNRVGRLERDMRACRHAYPGISEEAITMVAEGAFLCSLPKECLKDNRWFGKSLDQTSYAFYVRASTRLAARENPDYVSMGSLSKMEAVKKLKASGGEENFMGNQNPRRHDSRDHGNRNRDNRDNKEKCFHCGRMGHKKYECYKHLDQVKKRCLRCKRPGHSKVDCKLN